MGATRDSSFAQAVNCILQSNEKSHSLSISETKALGRPVSTKGYAQLYGMVYADFAGTLKIYQSSDGGTNYDLVETLAVTAGSVSKVIFDVYGETLKAEYVNGATAATMRINLCLIPMGSNLTVEGISLGAVKIENATTTDRAVVKLDGASEYALKVIMEDFPGAASTPAQTTLTMTLANTEYSHPIPVGTKKITVKTRDLSEFRLATTAGKVAGSVDPFLTINQGGIYHEENIATATTTLYVASPQAGKKVEILAWT